MDTPPTREQLEEAIRQEEARKRRAAAAIPPVSATLAPQPSAPQPTPETIIRDEYKTYVWQHAQDHPNEKFLPFKDWRELNYPTTSPSQPPQVPPQPPTIPPAPTGQPRPISRKQIAKLHKKTMVKGSTPPPTQQPQVPPPAPTPTPSQQPATPPSPGVQVPIMITRRMEQQLAALGLSQAEIKKLTPEEAWRIIKNQGQQGVPPPPAQTPPAPPQTPPAPTQGPPQQMPSPTFIPQTPEAIRLEGLLNSAREKYAEEYKKFLAERKKKTFFVKNVWRSVMGSTVEDSEIPPELKTLELEYDKATIAYGEHMFLEKRAELGNSTLSPVEQENELKRYKQFDIFSRVVVEEQSRLNGLKVENLPPKEKGLARKTLDWYLKQSRPTKILISTVLSTGVIVGTTALAAAIFSTGTVITLGATAAIGGGKLVRAVAGSTVGQIAAKGVDLLFKPKSAAKRAAAEKELAEMFKDETFDTGLAKSKKEYAEILERERKTKRNRVITKALVGLAAGIGTSVGIGYGINQINVLHNAPDQMSTTPPRGPHNPNARGELKKEYSTSADAKVASILAEKPPDTIPPPAPDTPPVVPGNVPATPGSAAGTGQTITTIKPGTPGTGIAQVINAAPGAGHEIIHDFSVKLGENGVPKNLETVFNEISADHMSLPTDGIIDEQFATKSLNMAANLVKLSEHHDVAGLSADDFDKVASFNNGVLQIKDPAGFNQLLSKLQTNSDELWTKGTLQGDGAAITQIKNINSGSWLKIVHADGMHEGNALDGTARTPTGILGHQEVDAAHIKNFNDSELVKHAIAQEHENVIANIRAKVVEQIDNKNAPGIKNSILEKAGETSTETASASAAEPQVTPEPDTIEKVINAEQQEYLKKQGFTGDPSDRKAVEEFFAKTRPGENLPSPVTEIVGTHQPSATEIKAYFSHNPYNLTTEKLQEVYETSRKDMHLLFSKDPSNVLQNLKHVKASRIIDHAGSANGDPAFGRMAEYLTRLKRFSGFGPRRFFGPETTEQYMARALQKITSAGKLDDFESNILNIKV